MNQPIHFKKSSFFYPKFEFKKLDPKENYG
jgi:hypothetical protein